MGSNVHYTIDLNEDQNNQPFFSPLGSSLLHHQVPSNPSLCYFPFSINSHEDQVDLGYNSSNTIHGVLDPQLSQSLEIKKFVSNDGSSSSDQIVAKKEIPRLKLTIRKKENHHEQTKVPDQYPTKGKTGSNSLKWISSKVRLMKKKKLITTTDNNKRVNNDLYSNLSNLEGHQKISTNQYNIIVNKNGYYGSNDCVIRICSDCNTTKTPLWRSGPRGPKSLCNACGIRQRKARRAAMAMATATAASDISPRLVKKKKMQNKNNIINGHYNHSSPSAPNEFKRMVSLEETTASKSLETDQSKSTMLSSSSSSSEKFYFDDLAIILSKSSAYNQVCPQDEKDAAILLMALSYGMVHG